MLVRLIQTFPLTSMGRRAPLALVLLALTGQGRSAPVPDDCGSLVHAALGGNVSVLYANGGHAVGPTPYCLVKVLLAPAINIVRALRFIPPCVCL